MTEEIPFDPHERLCARSSVGLSSCSQSQVIRPSILSWPHRSCIKHLFNVLFLLLVRLHSTIFSALSQCVLPLSSGLPLPVNGGHMERAMLLIICFLCSLFPTYQYSANGPGLWIYQCACRTDNRFLRRAFCALYRTLWSELLGVILLLLVWLIQPSPSSTMLAPW